MSQPISVDSEDTAVQMSSLGVERGVGNPSL